jgi:hypothetical protein
MDKQHGIVLTLIGHLVWNIVDVDKNIILKTMLQHKEIKKWTLGVFASVLIILAFAWVGTFILTVLMFI